MVAFPRPGGSRLEPKLLKLRISKVNAAPEVVKLKIINAKVEPKLLRVQIIKA